MNAKLTLTLALTIYAVTPVRAEPAPHALVAHIPPLVTEAGEPVELLALIDQPFAETLVVSWRTRGETSWLDVPFERSSAGGWFATLPPARPPGLEYFIHGTDGQGAAVAHFASAAQPHVVRVDRDDSDRLEDLDLARLAHHRNAVALDVTGHDFGNRYGLRDRFLRGEATYTYHLLRFIHHIAFGFGSLEGRTPSYTDDDMDTDVRRALRYGFGELRLRPHRVVFLDLRVALGVSHAGFDQGVRGVVTFGKPWRSNVSVGGELFGDVGGSAFVRLQWDTAAPVLMGASVVRSDMPGVTIDPNGLYIALDASYRIAERFTVKGQL